MAALGAEKTYKFNVDTHESVPNYPGPIVGNRAPPDDIVKNTAGVNEAGTYGSSPENVS